MPPNKHRRKKQQGDPNLSGGEVEEPGGVVGETPNTDTLSGDKEDEQHDVTKQTSSNPTREQGDF